MLLLSGCFVEEDPEADLDDVAEALGTSDGSTTAGKPAGTTAAGSVPVLADVLLNVTGLDVVFTITADDAENDTVTWVMDFGDNETANGTMVRTVEVDESVRPTGNSSLVANVTHTYANAGKYNVTVTLTDSSGSANRTVPVETGAGSPPVTPMEPMALSGSCTSEVSDGSHTFDVLPGQARILASITVGGGGIDLDWYIYDPSGAQADGAESFTVRAEGDLEVEAPAAGAWTIEVACFAGVAASYDIDLVFT